jgi:hypothetical protein
MRGIKLFIFLTIFFPSISFAQPVIEFVSENYNAGTVTQGDILEYDFEFINKGDEDLIIEKLNSS